MSEHESHCPFLNRADYRCSNHFSLDKLDRAFDHCFGEYQSCPTYREMLSERRSRQPVDGHLVGAATGLTSTVVYANLTVRTRPTHVTVNSVRLPVKHASAA
jgi:hypothetical protein